MLRPCEEIAGRLRLSVGAAGELDFMVPGAEVSPSVGEKGVCSSYALFLKYFSAKNRVWAQYEFIRCIKDSYYNDDMSCYTIRRSEV